MNIPSNAKCPKCQVVLTGVNAGHLPINVLFGKSYNGLAYACPSCQTLIGVEMDPIALKNDIVDELVRRLRG
jgi:hypothetical protein